MTGVETELIVALYALYGMECVKWLGAGEEALTRAADGGWKLHRWEATSFTLLRRMPVVADPLLLQPGFVRRRTDGVMDAKEQRALKRTGLYLDGLAMLQTQCRIQAVLLLLWLPLVIVMHRLSSMWPMLLGVILTSHVLLLVFLWRVLRRLTKQPVLKVMGPVLVNPLGATRTMEALSQVLFERNSRA